MKDEQLAIIKSMETMDLSLFEAFIGALFLDFNKINIEDNDNWFKNVFVTGPGFQIAQIFIENIFEKLFEFDTGQINFFPSNIKIII